ncbi:phosphomannose isomerase type II C-terminal cupin domain [Geminicoccus harenae]|uniref:phosphomannose isomerase type II C-terminal cupin domain n=1 Tax=Geminicoccus harenae TaxID=2498453 RepID=UPI00168B1D51|nr:phosphomannose isomerase type II C-terminal cupin domain [Geminicoccus harenae]
MAVVRYQRGESDERPWGRWEVLDTGATHAVKRITVKPGAKLSLQRHKHRAEHWVVGQGKVRVTRDEDSLVLIAGQAVYLPLGCVHRMENIGDVDLVIIEVQIGENLDENDIERLEDVYGRT